LTHNGGQELGLHLGEEHIKSWLRPLGAYKSPREESLILG
jgi:hypothetical protein